MTVFADTNTRNRAGDAIAIPSVCSAQPDVLAASLLLAQMLKRPVLVEATSNQVNQFGGYTGMTPADFIAFVTGIARDNEVDPELIHFGGDHLGPQVWRAEPAEAAMAKAADLMRAYVEAGFTKIHLDCSEGCKGEGAQVDDETAAARAAALAAVCEQYAPDPSKLSYVIGTEVPPPGGARADEEGQGIEPTAPERARYTLECHKQAFEREGIAYAWGKIIGLVVQPGLEFAPLHLDHFDMGAPNQLSSALTDEAHICFEAHSTDYQHGGVFPELARRNFTVLKVGPALTFAYRQALYSLDHIRAVLKPRATGTAIADTMENLMTASPANWQKHYSGTEDALRIQRHYSYADRIRYYWPEPDARQAVEALFADLNTDCPADPVLHQYFAPDIVVRAKTLLPQTGGWAQALTWAQIQTALRPYFFG